MNRFPVVHRLQLRFWPRILRQRNRLPMLIICRGSLLQGRGYTPIVSDEAEVGAKRLTWSWNAASASHSSLYGAPTPSPRSSSIISAGSEMGVSIFFWIFFFVLQTQYRFRSSILKAGMRSSSQINPRPTTNFTLLILRYVFREEIYSPAEV